jgi:hypothetical protein
MAAKKPPPKLVRPPIVLVVWEDATELDSTAWVHETKHEYKASEAVIHSIGFLLDDAPGGLVLTSAWADDGAMVARREQIPRGMIRKIVRVKA